MISKSIKTIIACLLCCNIAVVFTACQKDWEDPANTPFGNNNIGDENIITIAELKAQYSDIIFADKDQYALIDKDIKIKGRVSGNDIGGNIYKQLIIQDNTGAIVISVNQSGMHGFLAEGQELIVALKDLYIGGYRKQPQIGYPYFNANHNAVELGRMYKERFQQHFKIVGTPDPSQLDIIDDFVPTINKNENCARLVRLKDVSFMHPNPLGLGTFAPDTTVDKTVMEFFAGGAVNRQLLEYDKNTLVVRTSTYAKFAAMKLPYDEVNKRPKKCNITGIATRYNDVWQILIRKESDIEVLE